MGLAKNWYIELNENSQLVKKEAERRKPADFHKPFEEMKGYKKISDHLIELDINGEKKKVGIFNLVPEGMSGNFYSKRVQIKRSDLLELPDEIIVVYIHKNLNIFIRTNSVSSAKDLPQNITTLFRLDIRFLQETFFESVIKKTVISRHKEAVLTISRDFNLLFNEKQVEKAEETNQTFYTQDISLIPEDNDEDFDFTNADNAIDEKEIGRLAEEIVFNELKMKSGEIYEKFAAVTNIKGLTWMNEKREQFLPFDLKDDNIFIEVKGSVNSGKFIYSNNENEFRKANSKNYFLIKLDEIDLQTKKYSHATLYSSKNIEDMQMLVINYLVKEKNE